MEIKSNKKGIFVFASPAEMSALACASVPNNSMQAIFGRVLQNQICAAVHEQLASQDVFNPPDLEFQKVERMRSAMGVSTSEEQLEARKKQFMEAFGIPKFGEPPGKSFFDPEKVEELRKKMDSEK